MILHFASSTDKRSIAKPALYLRGSGGCRAPVCRPPGDRMERSAVAGARRGLIPCARYPRIRHLGPSTFASMVSRSANAALDSAPFARLAQMGLAAAYPQPGRGRPPCGNAAHRQLASSVRSGRTRARFAGAHVDRTLHDDEQAMCLASLRDLKKQRGDFVTAVQLSPSSGPLVAMVRHYSLAVQDSPVDDSPGANQTPAAAARNARRWRRSPRARRSAPPPACTGSRIGSR
jgi:hypothetical protein